MPSASTTGQPSRPAPTFDLPSAWPADVVAGLLARAPAVRELLPESGTVLDLSSPASRRVVRDAAFLATGLPRTGEQGEHDDGVGLPGPASVDAVVSVAALPYFADLPLALRGVSYLLAPAGRLVLCEPVGRPGTLGLLTASLAAASRRWRPALADLHLSRDVSLAVWAEGFTICSIERFSMHTDVWPLRHWMVAVASHVSAPGAGPADDGSEPS